MHVTQSPPMERNPIEHSPSSDSLVELDITTEGSEERNTRVQITAPTSGSFNQKSYGACDSINAATTTNTDRDLEKSTRLQGNSDFPNGQDPPNRSNTNHDDDECHCDASDKSTLLYKLAKRIPGLGIIFALCASCFLGSAGMLVKLTQSVHGIQVAVFRALIQLLIYGFVMNMRKLSIVPPRGERGPVLGRALLGACSITFSYYALKLIPLGDATTIRFSLPIWTLIVSYLVLGESCSLLKIGAVVVSVSGVVLISKPDDCIELAHLMLRSLHLEPPTLLATTTTATTTATATTIEGLDLNLNSTLGYHEQPLESRAFALEEQEIPREGMVIEGMGEQPSGLVVIEDASGIHVIAMETTVAATTSIEHHFTGCLLALMSSVCLAMSLIALRMCKKTSAEVTICWLSIFSIVIGTATLFGLREWSLPDNLRDVALILANGICGSIGQWFITSALKIEQSGVIALARTFDIEVAFLYSALLLQEDIRITSIVGSILVSSGVIAVVLPKWLNHRKSSKSSHCGSHQNGAPHHQSTLALKPEVASINASNQDSPETTMTSSSSSHLTADTCMLCNKRVSMI